MAQLTNVTDGRAARRFRQVRELERQLQIKTLEVANCAEHLKDLKFERDSLLARLRAAARDEGELPLFDLDEE